MVKVQVLDEFQRPSEILIGSFMIRNKPYLTSVTITPEKVLESESLSIEGIFNYPDKNKKVNMKAKLNNKVVYDPILNVQLSTGEENQKYQKWSLPLSQFQGLAPGTNYNMDFWLVTEDYVQTTDDYSEATDILNRSTSNKVQGSFRISFAPELSINENTVMKYYNSEQIFSRFQDQLKVMAVLRFMQFITAKKAKSEQ